MIFPLSLLIWWFIQINFLIMNYLWTLVKNLTWLLHAIIYTVMFDIVTFSSRILNFSLRDIDLFFFSSYMFAWPYKIIWKAFPQFWFSESNYRNWYNFSVKYFAKFTNESIWVRFFCLSRLWIFYYHLNIFHL